MLLHQTGISDLYIKLQSYLYRGTLLYVRSRLWHTFICYHRFDAIFHDILRQLGSAHLFYLQSLSETMISTARPNTTYQTLTLIRF